MRVRIFVLAMLAALSAATAVAQERYTVRPGAPTVTGGLILRENDDVFASPPSRPAFAMPAPRATLRADYIVVHKAARRLQLFDRGRLVKTYTIRLGFEPRGHKQSLGDGRTPEGLYFIEGRRDDSAFNLALRVSYPNASDRAAAERYRRDPGGNIYIHGLPGVLGPLGPMIHRRDWTDGCIAVTDTEMQEIYAAIPDGAPILIRP